MRISQNKNHTHARVEGDDTHLSDLQAGDTVAQGSSQGSTTNGRSTKEREAEISRLTWAVLDGKATSAERIRLAELVSAQHQG